MDHHFVREVFAARIFDERAAHERGQAWVVEALEGAGARANAERARKQRERVARFLKALAFRLAPPVARAERAVNSVATSA